MGSIRTRVYLREREEKGSEECEGGRGEGEIEKETVCETLIGSNGDLKTHGRNPRFHLRNPTEQKQYKVNDLHSPILYILTHPYFSDLSRI